MELKNKNSILLRISSLGVHQIVQILAHINFQKIRLTDLFKMHAHLEKIRPYMIIADHVPPKNSARLTLFGDGAQAGNSRLTRFISSIHKCVTGEFSL